MVGPEGPYGQTKGDETEGCIAQRLPPQLRRPGHQVLRNEAGSVMRQNERVFDHESSQVKDPAVVRAAVVHLRVLRGSECVNAGPTSIQHD